MQRRTWNKEEFEARAREREATERAGKKYKTENQLAAEAERDAPRAPVALEDATARPDMQAYDFKAMVGQRRVVTAENALSEQGGFYCEPCDYLLKDQKSYLEHCNKAQHLRRLGLPTEVRRATSDDVRARLEAHKSRQVPKKEERKTTVVAQAEKKRESKDDDNKGESKNKKSRSANVEEELEFDPAAFGLPASFGSSKK